MTKAFILIQVLLLGLTAAVSTLDLSSQDEISRDSSSGENEMPTMGMMMMMPMYFWSGNSLTWLVNGWDSTTGGSYFAGLLVSFILGFTIEALTYFRNYMYTKSQSEAIKRIIELNKYVSAEQAM